MSTWFKDRRQEFIHSTFRQFGQLRRADIMRAFDVSMPQASLDIAHFLAADPPYVRYDVTAKTYVLEDVDASLAQDPAVKADSCQPSDADLKAALDIIEDWEDQASERDNRDPMKGRIYDEAATLRRAIASRHPITVEQAALRDALRLAANRLHALSVRFDTGTKDFIEAGEWADEARAALFQIVGAE